MDKINLRGGDSGVTVISNEFFDNYMIEANGEYVKVYLYLLRCLSGVDKEFSLASLAETMEHTEKDIVRAIKYWESKGLLKIRYVAKEISSIEVVNPRAQMAAVEEIYEELSENEEEKTTSSESGSQAVEEANSIVEEARKKELSTEKLASLMADDEVKMLLYAVQTYMGKQLNTTDTNVVLYFYTELGFSSELIEYLVEYCVSNNHKTMRYIEKVALTWHENGVTTVAEAKNYITAYSNSCYPVLNAFGLQGRNPAATEKAFVVKWTGEYGFDMDIILDACNRTIDAIHKPSFQYADSILQRWMKKGVKTVEDLKAIDDEHEKIKEEKAAVKTAKKSAAKTQFNSFNQRTYDYDAMERILLQRK